MDGREALRAVAGGVLIWFALARAFVELVAALAAFGSAHLILRETPSAAHSPKPSE